MLKNNDTVIIDLFSLFCKQNVHIFYFVNDDYTDEYNIRFWTNTMLWYNYIYLKETLK